MNKEILKMNIEQVIMQPCIASPWLDGCKDFRPNGLSEDGKFIMVQIETTDSSWHCNIEGCDGNKIDYVERILERLPERYRDHLVTLRHDTWISYSYVPVFDTDTQKEWDESVKDYCDAKAEWCRKYGCD